jgi:hypothetical protein
MQYERLLGENRWYWISLYVFDETGGCDADAAPHSTDLIANPHNASLLGTAGREKLAANRCPEQHNSHTKQQLGEVDWREKYFAE